MNDDKYKNNILQRMSDTTAEAFADIASEDETSTSRIFQFPPIIDQTSATQNDHINTTDAPSQQSYNQGEQSVSGSAPDPESDDDTLANAQSMGQQLEEDTEHPQELDIARDIDAAEQNLVHD